MPGTELSWYGEITAGLLDLGPGAMIGGRAAAQLRRLDGFTADAVEFAVPRSNRNRSTNGVVRSSPDIERLDWEMVDGFPCASGTWIIIELLRDGTDDEASNAIDSACRQRLTAINVVRRRLDRMGRQGRAGVARFERLAAAGNVESWLERRFVDLIRRAGLPEPQLQQRYELADVGVARVDFEFEPRPIVVEVGGRRGYLSLDERRRQERRRNALQLYGKTIYFFTRDDVIDDPAYVVHTIGAALAAEPVTRDRENRDLA